MAFKLPLPVATYIEASNAADRAAFLAAFAEDAIVNDVQREFRGKAAIGAWADKEIFGANVRMTIERAEDHYGQIIVAAKIDGTYDKAGLPDPLLLTFYYSLARDRIASLIILLNKSASV